MQKHHPLIKMNLARLANMLSMQWTAADWCFCHHSTCRPHLIPSTTISYVSGCLRPSELQESHCNGSILASRIERSQCICRATRRRRKNSPPVYHRVQFWGRYSLHCILRASTQLSRLTVCYTTATLTKIN